MTITWILLGTLAWALVEVLVLALFGLCSETPPERVEPRRDGRLQRAPTGA